MKSGEWALREIGESGVVAGAAGLDVIAATRRGVARGEWRDMVILTKPGIVRMVMISAGVGFVVSALYRPTMSAGGATLSGLACLGGVGLCAAGANTLNQVMEVERDSRMRRTSARPLPAGRVPVLRGLLFGLLLSFLGLSLLSIVNGGVAAGVALATIVSYLVAYTPLKPVTPLATVIGAAPGALPPLIGWTAAATAATSSAHGGLADVGGWTLFGLMFVWQIPHFLAIAWKYREDYAAAGHLVLPVVDPSGGSTARAALAWSVMLLPVSLAPVWAMQGLLGFGYAVVATVGGGAMVWGSVRLLRARTKGAALLLFIVSIVYLPVVMGAMVVEALVRGL